MPTATLPPTALVPAALATALVTAPPTAPAAKKRKGLMGVAIFSQTPPVEQEQMQSPIDKAVKAEKEQFDLINQQVLAQGSANIYYEGGDHFNLLSFWADHKASLPLHFGVYVAEVGCKKVASANVETVFSGAGKFTEEAKSVGSTLLRRVVKMHYNWKFPFLRPSTMEVVARYNQKWPRGKAGPEAAAAAQAAKRVAEAAAAVAEAAAAAAPPAADVAGPP